MADYFFDGMPNVNERLNLLYTAFAAGPYNALPLTGGALTGPVTTTSTIAATSTGVAGIIEQLSLTTNSGGAGISGTAIRFGYPNLQNYGSRIVGGNDPTKSQAGYTAFETGSSGGFVEKMRITGSGSLLIGTTTDNGADKLQVIGTASLNTTSSVQGTRIFQAGLNDAQRSVIIFAGDGVLAGWPGTVVSVAKNSGTGRGIDTTGTVNTSGNDYAEYIFKCLLCGLIAKGQIVGITADNTITDKWADAVMFSIKSTAPSFVGGDSWAGAAGPRPIPQAGPAPTPPPRRADVIEQQVLPGTNPPEYQDVVTPGDTDAEWAEKQAAYTAALAAHNIAVQQDAEAMATFDAALEVERQKVDRIAIAGRVPVNVQGAQPGDYIVPVQDGTGIKGIAVHEDDLSMKQYFRAVGRVISVEPDGRAYVMVKVV